VKVIDFEICGVNIAEIVTRPVREKKQSMRQANKKSYIPPKDHSWRKFKFGKGRYDPGISAGAKP